MGQQQVTAGQPYAVPTSAQPRATPTTATSQPHVTVLSPNASMSSYATPVPARNDIPYVTTSVPMPTLPIRPGSPGVAILAPAPSTGHTQVTLSSYRPPPTLLATPVLAPSADKKVAFLETLVRVLDCRRIMDQMQRAGDPSSTFGAAYVVSVRRCYDDNLVKLQGLLHDPQLLKYFRELALFVR